jgi:hypothetical protein
LLVSFDCGATCGDGGGVGAPGADEPGGADVGAEATNAGDAPDGEDSVGESGDPKNPLVNVVGRTVGAVRGVESSASIDAVAGVGAGSAGAFSAMRLFESLLE